MPTSGEQGIGMLQPCYIMLVTCNLHTHCVSCQQSTALQWRILTDSLKHLGKEWYVSCNDCLHAIIFNLPHTHTPSLSSLCVEAISSWASVIVCAFIMQCPPHFYDWLIVAGLHVRMYIRTCSSNGGGVNQCWTLHTWLILLCHMYIFMIKQSSNPTRMLFI